MVASDKLFYWLFQNQPDRILPLLPDLPADASGYRFSAPVLKEREYRLDGLFLPPPQRPDLPALILEAQRAVDPKFLRRLYVESARLLEQETEIDHWRVVVLCPRRNLNYGRPQAAELDDLIAAFLISRFSGRSIQELCAMGGITLEDFTESVAYREIFGRGEARGVALGQAQGEAKVTLRQLIRRCGPLSAQQESLIRSLPLQRLEALAEALLDFEGMADLDAWLAANV